MNKLNNVNRPEGYPLVGQNLKILAEDYPKYIVGILNGLDLQANTCVFLQMETSSTNALRDSLVYIAHYGPDKRIGQKGDIYVLKVGNNIVAINELLSGQVKMSIELVNNGFGLTGFTEDISINTEAFLVQDNNSEFSFLTYVDALKYSVLKEVIYNNSEIKVGVYNSSVITNSAPNLKDGSIVKTGSLIPDFNNTLKKQGDHCFVQLGVKSTKNSSTNQKVVITLPNSFRANGYLPVLIGHSNSSSGTSNNIDPKFYSMAFSTGFLFNNFLMYDATDYDLQYITVSYFASNNFNAYIGYNYTPGHVTGTIRKGTFPIA